MKKHDEGYALVLVLVVITVLCLVAMAMMAASLKNLTNQQSSIERMQAKYEAQGEIEKVIGTLEANFQRTGSGDEKSVYGLGQDMIDNACENTEGNDNVQTVTAGTLTPVYSEGSSTEIDCLVFTLTTIACGPEESDTAAITCTIKITGNIEETSNGLYNVTGLKWCYDTYTIIRGGDE